DTAEYARPLYPYHDSGPATDSRPPRSWPDDDPFLDTDARPRLVPGERRPALPPGRSARRRSPGRAPALPEPQDLTIPPGRRRVPPVLPEPQDLTSPRRRRGKPPALNRRADRTGPQRRLSDLDLADGPAESGMGFAPGSARSRGAIAEYSVSDLARDSSSQAPDPQVTATLAPPRSPAKPGRRPRKGGSPKPAKSRSKPGRDRARAGKPASAGRPRRRVPVKARIVLGVVIVAALGVAGYVFLLPKTSHVVSAPAHAGSYVRQQADATANGFKQRIVKAA